MIDVRVHAFLWGLSDWDLCFDLRVSVVAIPAGIVASHLLNCLPACCHPPHPFNVYLPETTL